MQILGSGGRRRRRECNSNLADCHDTKLNWNELKDKKMSLVYGSRSNIIDLEVELYVRVWLRFE